jgi:hypothetical protein
VRALLVAPVSPNFADGVRYAPAVHFRLRLKRLAATYSPHKRKSPAGGAGLFNIRRPGGSGGSWAAYQLVVAAAGMVQTFS